MAKKDKIQDQAENDLVEDNEAEIEAETEAETGLEETVEDGLVAVHKGGETLRVHPTTLNAHHAAGWKVH